MCSLYVLYSVRVTTPVLQTLSGTGEPSSASVLFVGFCTFLVLVSALPLTAWLGFSRLSFLPSPLPRGAPVH